MNAKACAALVTLLLVVLTGCAGTTRPEGASTQGASAKATAPSVDTSSSLDLTLSTAYGQRLIAVEKRDSGDGAAMLTIYLQPGEVSGRPPFAALASLAHSHAGLREYRILYRLPMALVPPGSQRLSGRAINYIWRPAAATLTRYEGVYDVVLGTESPVGTASGVTTETLTAVATGRESVPEFDK